MKRYAEKNGVRSDLIAEKLEEAGKSVDVVNALGISKQHLWQIKTGLRLPSIPLLRKILDVTGLDFNQVVPSGEKVFLPKV